MTSRVTKIHHEFSFGSLRSPVVWGTLDCGHTVDVPLLPYRLRCDKCGTERAMSWSAPSESAFCKVCGCGVATYAFTPNPHNPEHQTRKVGDEVDCERCRHFAEAAAAIRALDRSTLSHARLRGGSFYVYRHAPESPSGVLACAGIEARPEAEAILREVGLAPLSPTEGLRQPRPGERW